VGRISQKQLHSVKATVINTAKAKRRMHSTLPDVVKKHLKKIDAAISGDTVANFMMPWDETKRAY
jgi:hypothetical protein